MNLAPQLLNPQNTRDALGDLRAPVVAIAGLAETTRMHKESHQYLDLVQIFEPISKYAAQIRAPETIPEIIRKAFKQAEAEKPLELPSSSFRRTWPRPSSMR